MTLNELQVLRELADGPRTGGDIKDRTSIPRATIYTLLNRMIAKGWLKRAERAIDLNLIEVVYSRTRQGKEEMRRTLELLQVMPVEVDKW